MSSVLHPVGPEPRERYWVRRLAVVVAAIVAISIVVALVGNAMSAGSAVQAEPAPPTILPPAVTATPTPTPVTSGTASPTPGATTSGTPAATPSASPSPTTSSTASPKSSTPATPKKEASKKKAPAKTKKATQPVYTACDGDDLRSTLTGDRTVGLKKKTTFSLSLINGGKKTCTVTVKPSAAALTIVSGGDRIWSTKDCPAAQPTTKRTLLPEHALTWKVTWSGKRSGDDCSTGKVAPKKGYYWAIASFDGADDVRFRVILG